MRFEFVVKYLCGKASPEEALELDKWITSSPENRLHFEQLEKAWLEAGNEQMIIPDSKSEWAKFEKLHVEGKGSSSNLLSPRNMLIAASLIGALALGYYFLSATNEIVPAPANTEQTAPKSEAPVAPAKEAVVLGSFNFPNTKMSEVASQLSKRFNIPVSFANKKLENCTISASFENETLENIVSVIAGTLNLDYTYDGKSIVFTGEASCD